MRTFATVALVTLTLATGGCATFSRSSGVAGGPAVSGEANSAAAESGADYDNIATSGSNGGDPTAPGGPAPQ